MEHYPQAFIDYMVHFHASRDFFECHELLEEHWKKEQEERLKPIWVGLIQVAVGLYHQRRGNSAGALKMLRSAMRLLDGSELQPVGLDREELLRRIHERVEAIERREGYADMALPIDDEALRRRCRSRCAELGYEWLAPSRLDDPELVDRHTRRDRSEVVRERERALAVRRGRRG